MSPFIDDIRADAYCRGCDDQLNTTEAEIYDGICGFCARYGEDRTRAWRGGTPDRELDEGYAWMKRRRLQ